RPNGNYTPQYYDRFLAVLLRGWKPADDISNQSITLNNKVFFYNTAGPINVSPNGQPCPPSPAACTPSQSDEIRFNTRGFPVNNSANPPTTLQQANAVYLTDGQEVFAVTVNILGRIQVWAYDTPNNTWVGISR